MNIFIKILFYFLVKYSLCFLVGMLESNNFSILKINNLKNPTDIFLYCWIILFFPVINFCLFFLPINFSLKLKRNKALILNLLFIIIEILIYIYFTSQKYTLDSQTLVLFLSSIICFIIFFNKELKFFQKNIK